VADIPTPIGDGPISAPCSVFPSEDECVDCHSS
jgi:hypothetical protein